MAKFLFQDLSRFQGSCTAIKRPIEVTQFSFDEHHQCHPLSSESLRYYYPPFFSVPGTPRSRGVDLSLGFETFRKYEESTDLHLDALLDTIEAHENETSSKLDVDIITWRGMMTKILTAPYDDQGDFEMNATSYDGTIFIEENKQHKLATENANQRRKTPFAPEMMQYWGYKFETLSTLAKPWSECSRRDIEGRDHDIVDNHSQYCSVVRTGIGQHRILIGGEVDAVLGIKADAPDLPHPYVELKTSQDFSSNDPRASERFEQKMCRFWAQSFLLGVPTIIVGFRSRDGFLERLQEWKTLDIPNFVKQRGMRTWDGNVCINFAASFLDFLRDHVHGQGTWRIQKERGAKEITLFRTSEEVDPEIVTGNFKIHRQKFYDAVVA